MDVSKVSAEANAQNTSNAYQQSAFNRPNQTNQYGSTLSYQQTGTDAQGNPIFSQNQSLGQQGQQFAGGFADLGQQYIQGASDFQANRPDMGSNAAFDRAYDYASANLEPRFQRASEAMDTKLKNQGLDPTSEAYKSAANDLALQQNEARNSLVTNLQGQMFNQGLADRSQQQGEFALLNPGVQYGGNAITGGFANVPGVNVANVDVAGLNQQNQNDQWKKYQSDMQSYNGMLGGLASIGGTILGGPIGGYMAKNYFGGGSGGSGGSGK